MPRTVFFFVSWAGGTPARRRKRHYEAPSGGIRVYAWKWHIFSELCRRASGYRQVDNSCPLDSIGEEINERSMDGGYTGTQENGIALVNIDDLGNRYSCNLFSTPFKKDNLPDNTRSRSASNFETYLGVLLVARLSMEIPAKILIFIMNCLSLC
jgi:hypothetical protein